LERKQQLPDGTFQGINSFQRLGYDGPCPPKGPPHHYIFTLYALDRPIDIQGTATFESLQEAMKGHILGKAQLIGIFQSKE
jgi:Raf kinase inhibitor-like YbhB/YbcL family protein